MDGFAMQVDVETLDFDFRRHAQADDQSTTFRMMKVTDGAIDEGTAPTS